ncbi:hypothetical protein MYSTI_07817 [Myxococcus stipitatus DSM 14675]|uniref:Uncharacterized protein n=1 Tax=Myxococcus stipitatus (strain DSM 14675 / JCM 12634 / Mx s8) TaxID=1278073 RepID=L7UR76_MYXSD|nr:hypothetical protein [Myxococcus stipitatus]AGC49089.1 hypothetical protein MYSTI_07817 [Myxococcus stipitatus DSM 14675]
MALPAHHYARAALKAELHVQVEVVEVVLPAVTPGNAWVTGRIARVFKGKPGFLSSRVTFEVPCRRPGDSPPPSGIRWKDTEALEKAAVMEVYLTPHEGRYHVAGYSTVLLEAVTDEPQRTFTEEDGQPPVPPRARIPRWGVLLLIAAGALAAFLVIS